MRKIIVLDDSPDILEIVNEVLTYEHFDVRCISTCAELLPLAEMYLPDLILLDLRLTDGNGGELCSSIKCHPLLHETPVVIFTAYISPSNDLSSYHCDAVIWKPFDISTLIDTVDNLTKAK